MIADGLVELTAVVRCGSISAAASELAMSQSALSRHMLALEAALGEELLERGTDGVRLTTAGRRAFEAGLDLADVGGRLQEALLATPVDPSEGSEVDV